MYISEWDVIFLCCTNNDSCGKINKKKILNYIYKK